MMNTRILIVSEIDEYISLLTRWLQDESYQVIGVFGVSRLIELVEELKPKLILLNIEVGGVEGIEISHKLKSNALTANIPILFIHSEENMFLYTMDSCFNRSVVIDLIKKMMGEVNFSA